MNPKNKGNSFERKISNLLSEKFKEKTGIEKSFKRNADSGSFFGGTNQKRTEQYDLTKANFGDIICPDNFLFNIECKHYKTSPSFSLILSEKVKQWDTWIVQAEQDALNSKKKMMLIIKYNGVDEIVILNQKVENLKSIINYKEYYIYNLSDLLNLNSNFFFS